MTSEDIQRYLATGEWRDKAGAYGIQGRISRFVARVEGWYTNVVGLPVALVWDLLMRYPDGTRNSQVPTMKHKAVKVGLTSLVLALAFGGLLYSTMGEATEYYKHVDEVMAQPSDWYGKKLQLHGYVVPESILKRKSSLEYRFQVQSNGHVVHATYTGVVPDTFKSEAEVVLEGHAVAGWVVHGGAQWRDGQVPVEVRSEAGKPDVVEQAVRSQASKIRTNAASASASCLSL